MELTNSDKIEILAQSNEETIRLLGSLGLYDASFDLPHYTVTEHPEDDKWIQLSEN